jgi:hypothetical protein
VRFARDTHPVPNFSPAKESLLMNAYRALSLVLLLAPAAASAQTVPSFCSGYPQTVGAGDWQASRVFYTNGRLTYVMDSNQNRIPDYSYAGYGYGAKAIPSIPQRATLSPTTGDQTARIQAALNAVQTPGALVLAAGSWEVRGTINVNRNGLVLRGSGDGTTGTVLRATGDSPHQRPVIAVGTRNSTWTEGTRTNITTPFVPVNAMSFDVASTSGLSVGQAVVIRHPSTQAWINAIDGGGMQNEADWAAGSVDILYYRRIRGISGNRVTLDAPVYNHLDRSLAQSTLAPVTVNVLREVGVEDLRIDIVTSSSTNENHAWNGVDVQGAHDSWIRGVTALHFGSAGIVLENAVNVTVENSQALDPHGVRTGGRFYNFNNEGRSQLNLFRNCTATLARHSYISNGTSTSSGLVYTRSRQQGGGSEGGHRRWVQGVLYDNIDETGSGGQVLLINRGDFGTSHGWGAVHSTIWKYDSEMLAQKPPTAQNYAFSNAGHFRTSVYFPGAFGVQELRSGRLVPESLYEAQLCERLGTGTTPTDTPTPTPTTATPTPTPTPTPTTPTSSPTPTGTPTPTPTPTPTGATPVPVEINLPATAATANTNDGNVPANAIDNNLDTRWSGNGDGAWIRFDLGTPRQVTRVQIAWYQGNTRSSRFDLQVSDNGTTWTTVSAGLLSSGTTTNEEAFTLERTTRYVRYLGHGNNSTTKPTWSSVAEVSIFAVP